MLGSDPFVFIYKQGYDSGLVGNRDKNRRTFNNYKTEELGFIYNRKDIKLYPYGKQPKEDSGNYDPSVKEPTIQDIERISISSFVLHMEHNIDDSDDPSATMKKIVRSMFIADEEMKRIKGKYPKKYFGSSWGTVEIDEFMLDERRKAGFTPNPPRSIIVPCARSNACGDASLAPVPK